MREKGGTVCRRIEIVFKKMVLECQKNRRDHRRRKVLGKYITGGREKGKRQSIKASPFTARTIHMCLLVTGIQTEQTALPFTFVL